MESLAFAERPDSIPDGDKRELRTFARNMSFSLFRNPHNIFMKITYIWRFYAMNPGWYALPCIRNKLTFFETTLTVEASMVSTIINRLWTRHFPTGRWRKKSTNQRKCTPGSTCSTKHRPSRRHCFGRHTKAGHLYACIGKLTRCRYGHLFIQTDLTTQTYPSQQT